jgi:selenocysteine lyase/cysteine desulfurase
MLDSFGLEGTVRVSPLHCNSLADMEKFLHVTQEIALSAKGLRTGTAG